MINKRWMLGVVCSALMLPMCSPACSHAQTPPAEPSAAPSALTEVRAATEARAHAERLRERVAAVAAGRGQGNNGFYWYANGRGKKEKATYLGVTAVQADPALRDQLKMPRGIGLVIQAVEPNTPASKAGLQEHDLITKVDDQWLVNSQQFGVLIRMHKPDDEITITGLRHGDPITIKAKLVEKEMVISDAGDASGDSQISWAGTMQPDGDMIKEMPQLFMVEDNAPLVISEGDATLKVTVEDGQRHLEATDKDGNETFNGAVETEEQRKALPADLAQLLDKYKEQFNKVKEDGGKQRIRIITNDR